MKIREFVSSRFPSAHHHALGDEVSLLDAGVIDSLGVLDLSAFLEKTFGIRILDDELTPENFGSIGGLVRFVESKR